MEQVVVALGFLVLGAALAALVMGALARRAVRAAAVPREAPAGVPAATAPAVARPAEAATPEPASPVATAPVASAPVAPASLSPEPLDAARLAEAIAAELQLDAQRVQRAVEAALAAAGRADESQPEAPLHPEFAAVFKEEAAALLSRLQIDLRRWSREPGDAARRAAMLRTLHMLKGSARVAGADRLGGRAHRLEHDIESLRGTERPSAVALQALASQLDAMRATLERVPVPAAGPATVTVMAQQPPTAGARSALRRSAAGAPAAPPPVAGSPSPAAGVAAPPLVLVVDDSLTVRVVAQRLLQRAGFRVALADDGLQALARLQEERPSVVLSDVEMPRMDGFDLVRNIRSDGTLAGLPIIMITSRIAEKHREYARQLGVNHYLGKPYAEDELLRLVRHYAGAADAPLAAA